MRAVVAALVASIVVVAFAGSASAASSVTRDGTTVNVATDAPMIALSTRAFTATVTIRTTRKPARFTITDAAPLFARRIAKRRVVEGSTLRPLGLVSVDGATSQLSGSGTSYGFSGGCEPVDENANNHGGQISYGLNEFHVRSHHVATLTYKYEVVGDPPWIDTSYSPRIFLEPIDKFRRPSKRRRDPKHWSEFTKKVSLTVTRPRLAIPIAGRVDLDFTPRPRFDGWDWRKLPAGKKLHLSGALVPARAGYPIRLWLSGNKKAIDLVTDANGRFKYAFTPVAGKTARIRAEYPGMPGSDLLPDSGCGVRLGVARKRGSK